MIRVMTLNVRYSEAQDGPNAWPHRAESLFETIRSHDPDLLGLQESDERQCREITAALGDRWVAIHREGIDPRTPDAHGKAIYFRRDRFEEAGRGAFWISETPQVPGSILLPNDWGERTVIWARLRDRRSPAELVFACTHFDTNPGCAKRSAEILDKELGKVIRNTPTIVVGDFNTPAGSPAWKQLTGPAGFKDAWQLAGALEVGVITFNGWTMMSHQPNDAAARQAYLSKKYGTTGNGPHHNEEYGRLRNERIDWVLVKGGLTCSAAQADTTLFGGRYASDHFAVVADVGTDGLG